MACGVLTCSRMCFLSKIILLGLSCLCFSSLAFSDDLPALETAEDTTVAAPAGTTDLQQAIEPVEDWITRSRRPDSSSEDASPSPMRSILALLVVLGGLLLVRFLILRKGLPGGRSHMPPLLKMVSRLRVGSRQEVVVVAFQGKHLLLGVTPENIRILTEVGAPDADVAIIDDATGAVERGRPDAT